MTGIIPVISNAYCTQLCSDSAVQCFDRIWRVRCSNIELVFHDSYITARAWSVATNEINRQSITSSKVAAAETTGHQRPAREPRRTHACWSCSWFDVFIRSISLIELQVYQTSSAVVLQGSHDETYAACDSAHCGSLQISSELVSSYRRGHVTCLSCSDYTA